MDGDACCVCLLASLRNVKDAAWQGVCRRIDRRKRHSTHDDIHRWGRDNLRNEDREPGTAHAARAILRAWVRRRTSRVLYASVWDDAGKKIRTLHRKGGKPYGEKEPHHGLTIARSPRADPSFRGVTIGRSVVRGSALLSAA